MTQPSSFSDFPVSRRTPLWTLSILGVLFAALLLAGCSSSTESSSTTTSAASTTTSGQDPDVAQVIEVAKAQAVSSGLVGSNVTVTATVSPVNDSWMKIEVTPTNPSSDAFQPYYGYAHQGANWTVVAFGSAQVGCVATSPNSMTTAPNQGVVPRSVIESFNMSCATTTTTAG